MGRLNHEFPDITISSCQDFDSMGAPESEYVEIAVESCAGSNGFIILDQPADLHILRRAIDEYTKIHNIKPIPEDEDERKI